MRRLSSLLLVLVSVACGSSGNRPADVAKPSITVRQASPLFFSSVGATPVSIDVSITNNATVPVTVREIELRSPGMMQYTLQRTSKLFHEIIPPGTSRTLGLVATATTSTPNRTTAEPLAVQAVVRFEANGRGFREVIMEQFAGSGM
jgi:hypothetical protein